MKQEQESSASSLISLLPNEQTTNNDPMNIIYDIDIVNDLNLNQIFWLIFYLLFLDSQSSSRIRVDRVLHRKSSVLSVIEQV